MADDSSNKVVIELDLENSTFKQKGAESKNVFESLGASAKSVFETSLVGAISLNQALELGAKIIEGFEAALRQIEFAESFKNQQTALTNLTGQIGVDAAKLTESIKVATGGTVTSIEATQTAFKLLQAGIRAENIPAMVAFAETIEKTSGGTKKFDDVIQALATSVDIGATRSLRQFGINVKETGDRQQLVNAILEQAKIKTDALGTGYDEVGKRLSTTISEGFNKAKVAMGDFFSKVAFNAVATDAEKAENSIKKLESELAGVNAAAANGQKSFEMWNDKTKLNEFVDAATKRADIEQKLEAAKAQSAVATGEEKNKQDELNKSLQQTAEIQKPLTDFQKQRADLFARLAAAQAQSAAEEEKDGVASIKTSQDVLKAKQTQIEQEFANRKHDLEATATNETVLKEKLVALETEKIQRIRALRVSDDDFNRVQGQAQLNYFQANNMAAENVMQNRLQIESRMETEAYNKEIERLRNSGLAQEQFQAQMEQKEAEHQVKLLNIKKQYEGFTMQNFQLGINQSLTAMKTQYGSFSAFTANATTKTQQIMSNSFVQMAKNHAFSMDQMINQFLEMIGTQMIESGTYYLLLGAASFDPAQAGMGAALIGAGMALVGASGGGGSSSPSAGAASGGAGVTSPGGASPSNPTQNQTQSKSAQIIINGDYLNSRETANHLADVLRENSDVTDYTITAQGKQYA